MSENRLGVVARDIAPTVVIGENQDDVRAIWSRTGVRYYGGKKEDCEPVDQWFKSGNVHFIIEHYDLESSVSGLG